MRRVAASAILLALTGFPAGAQARETPDPVRDRVHQATLQLGLGILGAAEAGTAAVVISGRSSRCPRPEPGRYECHLRLRYRLDESRLGCPFTAIASRRGARLEVPCLTPQMAGLRPTASADPGSAAIAAARRPHPAGDG